MGDETLILQGEMGSKEGRDREREREGKEKKEGEKKKESNYIPSHVYLFSLSTNYLQTHKVRCFPSLATTFRNTCWISSRFGSSKQEGMRGEARRGAGRGGEARKKKEMERMRRK